MLRTIPNDLPTPMKSTAPRMTCRPENVEAMRHDGLGRGAATLSAKQEIFPSCALCGNQGEIVAFSQGIAVFLTCVEHRTIFMSNRWLSVIGLMPNSRAKEIRQPSSIGGCKCDKYFCFSPFCCSASPGPSRREQVQLARARVVQIVQLRPRLKVRRLRPQLAATLQSKAV